jgi:hypothetical protein
MNRIRKGRELRLERYATAAMQGLLAYYGLDVPTETEIAKLAWGSAIALDKAYADLSDSASDNYYQPDDAR